MQRKLLSYPLTLLAVIVLALSYVIFILGSAGALPTDGIWRNLVIPAYVTMLVSALVRTTLPVARGVADGAFLLVGVALCLLPFFTVDWLVGRLRRRRSAPTA